MGLLSAEELHFLGIKVVYKDLIDNGYEVLQVRKELHINPQLLATHLNKKYLIVVRTAIYPHMGVLTPILASQMSELAHRMNATILFGGVGIANANGETETEMSQPLVGGEYYIRYDGLRPIVAR